MPKAVLFDFDGTLANTRPFLYAAYQRLAEKHNLKKVTPEELEKMKSLSIKDRFITAGISPHLLPRLARDALLIYGELMDTAAPYPGIPEILHALKSEGLVLCIVSSNSAKNIYRFLNAHNLDLFDRVCAGSSLFGKHRAIKRVIKSLGIGRQEVVYVGDELRDIIGCKKVPLKIIAVSWGYDHVSLLQKGKPDFLVHNPSEITGLLGQT